jgi:hypothetical protein
MYALCGARKDSAWLSDRKDSAWLSDRKDSAWLSDRKDSVRGCPIERIQCVVVRSSEGMCYRRYSQSASLAIVSEPNPPQINLRGCRCVTQQRALQRMCGHWSEWSICMMLHVCSKGHLGHATRLCHAASCERALVLALRASFKEGREPMRCAKLNASVGM